jgi:hypothetical protein
MSDWEELLENEKFEPVHAALRAGIALLEKYYRRADDTNAYFISHSKSSLLVIVIEFIIKTMNIQSWTQLRNSHILKLLGKKNILRLGRNA